MYGLPAEEAEALAALAGTLLTDITTVAGAEALEARYVNHQLAVNGCLLAIGQACRAHHRSALHAWTADPHARVRYRVGRSRRTVHPDAVATIEVDGRRRWMYLKVDRGTAELRRHGCCTRRPAVRPDSARRRTTATPEGWTGVMWVLTSSDSCDGC